MTHQNPVAIRVVGVDKSFGATRALVGADLEVRPGEVHTIMGENGSGKSTLVKLLAGVHRADAGSIEVHGMTWSGVRSPASARHRGVATVFQEVLTVPGSSIVENVWLGTPTRGTTAPGRRARTEQLLGRLVPDRLDVERPVEQLTLSERQACCIARSLVIDPQVLVLDESTSALDVETRNRLFALVRELTARGGSVVFVSHRMDEVFEVSDVVTVLRSGTTVASRIPIGDTTVDRLVRLMSGDDAGTASPRESGTSGEVVLRCDGVRLERGAAQIDLEIRAGEIVGLAGLEGQGQDVFIKTLRGGRAAGGQVVRVRGAETMPLANPRAGRRARVAYVPRERRAEGMFEQLSIWENFGLSRLRQDTIAGVVSVRRTARRLIRYSGPLRVKLRHVRDPISTLSGGNQQKIIIARALAEDPDVLLLNDPTRGIDIGAKHDLYAVLHELSERGAAVVLLSSEVDELVHLVDRVVVFRDQEAVCEIPRSALTRAAVVSAYFGVPTGDDEPAQGLETPYPPSSTNPTPLGTADASEHVSSRP